MNNLVASCPLAGGDAGGSLNSQVSINSVPLHTAGRAAVQVAAEEIMHSGSQPVYTCIISTSDNL